MRFAPDDAICILGCGYTGAVIAQRLAFDGRPVMGTTRSQEQANVIRTRGAVPVIVDLPDLEPLKRHAGSVAGVICLVPPSMQGRGETYADWTGALLEFFATRSDIKAFVYVSSTSVYGDAGGEVVTERSECRPDSPRGRARREIEQQVAASTLPTLVVRPSGIYGPGRSQAHRLARRAYRLVGQGDALTNRIHVRDLASITIAALDRGHPGETYLASDQLPASQHEVVDFCMRSYGLPEPNRLSLAEARIRMTPNVFKMVTGSKRLDASWTLARLGVTLRFPTYKEGLAAIWHQEGDAISLLAAS